MINDIKNLIIYGLLTYVLYYIIDTISKNTTKNNTKQKILNDYNNYISNINSIMVETVKDYNLDHEKIDIKNFTLEDALHCYNMLRNTIKNSEYICENDKDEALYILDDMQKMFSISKFIEVIYCIIYNKGMTYDTEVTG